MTPQQTPRPYVRPMRAWWKRNAFFKIYMWRELTAVAVLAYAVVLAVGVIRLSQGESAWNEFMLAVKSPAGVLLHVVILVSMVVHTKSWFEIMPKTMPMIWIGGKRSSNGVITRLGWTAAVVVSIGGWFAAKGLWS